MEPPQVACRECKMAQSYIGQKECVHCKKDLVCIPPWAAEIVNSFVLINGKLYQI